MIDGSLKVMTAWQHLRHDVAWMLIGAIVLAPLAVRIYRRFTERTV